MFVKEEEAKTKLCPLSFNRPAADPTRDTGGMHTWDPPWVCKGSECMAWRWAKMSPEGYVLVTGTKEAAQTLNGPDWKTGGYCGLAGRPVT